MWRYKKTQGISLSIPIPMLRLQEARELKA
jgi:hypothetical protein